MATLELRHDPSLDRDRIERILREGLGDRYVVRTRGRSVLVAQTGWKGVAVKVAQDADAGRTTLRTSRLVPGSANLVALVGLILLAVIPGVVANVLAQNAARPLEGEVVSFLRDADGLEPVRGRSGPARAARRTADRPAPTILELTDVHAYYGNIEALKGVSLEVREGEIVTLIGSNGAGKSTTLRSISGLTPPREGSIRFDGAEIGETPPQEIVELGISQSPEGRKCFQRMTVRENLELGAYLRRDGAGVDDDLGRVFELFPRLEERERQKAGTMSGGEQQMLAIGRALMARPTLLLLDEPSMGIAPVLVERIYETIEQINRQGTTILLVEQNANFALGVSQRGYVLETGRIALADDSDALRDNPEVQRAYLGT